MKKPSEFISFLVAMTGTFFVLAALLKEGIAFALLTFIFFFIMWAGLEITGRDIATDTTRQRYRSALTWLGACGLFVAPYYLVVFLVDGNYVNSVRLAVIIWLLGNQVRDSERRKKYLDWMGLGRVKIQPLGEPTKPLTPTAATNPPTTQDSLTKQSK